MDPANANKLRFPRSTCGHKIVYYFYFCYLKTQKEKLLLFLVFIWKMETQDFLLLRV